MGSDVYIAGVGMTRFTTHLDKTYPDLCAIAIDTALDDAGMDKEKIQGIFFSNSFWGHHEGQHCIRGQCALRSNGLLGVPIINVENACASASTALYLGYMAVKSGEFDVVLCLGAEKIAHLDKKVALASFTSGFDLANFDDTMKLYEDLTKKYEIAMPPDDGLGKSQAMETYGIMARWHMWKYGTTQEQLAKVEKAAVTAS